VGIFTLIQDIHMKKKITVGQALMTIAIACIATVYRIVRDFLYWAFRIEFRRERERRIIRMQTLLDEEHSQSMECATASNV